MKTLKSISNTNHLEKLECLCSKKTKADLKRLTKFYNETARLNDPKTLGASAQSIVNRLGNTQIQITGDVRTISEIDYLGAVNLDNEKLVSLNLQKKATRV